MIPYDLDPSLYGSEPEPQLLDDGFSSPHQGQPPILFEAPPAEAAESAQRVKKRVLEMSTHPVEPESLPPGPEPLAPNPTRLPVEPEFGPELPPAEPEDPKGKPPTI